jgi:hypothetical protein
MSPPPPPPPLLPLLLLLLLLLATAINLRERVCIHHKKRGSSAVNQLFHPRYVA